MSLGQPIHALNNQTNINGNRYFFATQEAGEQELFVSTLSGGGPQGNISSLAVGISGPAGNAVVVSEAPTFIASEFVAADQGLAVGVAGYWTISTLSTALTGVSISSDRLPGSGLASIESYSGNGPFKGFEFLSRGLDSALISTPMNSYLSTIGAPGATAKLGGNGSLVTGLNVIAGEAISLSAQDTGGGVACFSIYDLSGGNVRDRWSLFKSDVELGGNTGTNLNLGVYNDAGTFVGTCLQVNRSTASVSTINSYAYPQPLFSSPTTAIQGTSLPSTIPTVLYTINNAVTSNMVAGQNYLIDLPIQVTTGNPGATPAYLEVGFRGGGNGGFNYGAHAFIPPGGIPFYVAVGCPQIIDMGSANKNIDVIGYLQGAGPLSISTGVALGQSLAFIKQMT